MDTLISMSVWGYGTDCTSFYIFKGCSSILLFRLAIFRGGRDVQCYICQYFKWTYQTVDRVEPSRGWSLYTLPTLNMTSTLSVGKQFAVKPGDTQEVIHSFGLCSHYMLMCFKYIRIFFAFFVWHLNKLSYMSNSKNWLWHLPLLFIYLFNF